MWRSLRPWWLALGISLLLHVALIGGGWWSLPQWISPDEPVPFEARLVPVSPPPMAPARPKPAPPPPAVELSASRSPEPAPVSPLSAEPAVEDAAAVAPEPELPAVPAPVEPAVSVVEAGPVAQPVPAPVVMAAPPLNALPSRVDLRFQVNYGIASGEQMLVWINEGGQRYTVISVAEATGLAGLFYRGKFVQTSRGRITPHGLQPEAFWDQRGDKRSSALFDAAQGHLALNPDKGPPRHFTYQGDVQDVLSLFFQLALTAPPSVGELSYTVFNGKKLRDYRYAVRGEVLLETAVGPLRALHLARMDNSDGRFEVWLAIDRHYLPVRVLKTDDKNNEVELKLLSMAP